MPRQAMTTQPNVIELTDGLENPDDFNIRQVSNNPRGKLTTSDDSAIPTGSGGTYVDSGAITIINNMRTRINELESALKQLGLLK